MSEEKITEDKYDVFFCYNHEDEFSVKKIRKQLKEKGINPWLYSLDIRPGTSRQEEIEKQIETIPSAAVFVGQAGTGPWQELEIRAWLREFVKRNCPVIPVFLENASGEPELPLLLQDMQWVDFRVLQEKRDLSPEEDPLNRLIWGITEKRVRNQQHVLIASLGESPVVVSAMYDLLTKRKGLTIDQVIVLHPQGEDVERAYELVRKALPDRDKLRNLILPFEDANSWTNACIFLKELYILLDTCQVRGDAVYLSLAGGRKSMAALMAWIVPFFSCVEHLYHVIDPNEDDFLSIYDLDDRLTPSGRELAMHPDLDPLILVDIPFASGQKINQQLISHLCSAETMELAKMEYEEAKKAHFAQAILQEGKILEAWVTEQVRGQFHSMCQQDKEAARRVRDCLERMQSTIELRNLQPDAFLYKYKPPKSAKPASVYLHSFESWETSVHPVFYTQSQDIYTSWDKEVERVVICALDTGEDGGYKSLQEITRSPGFSIKKAHHLEKLPLVPNSATVDSVLIVPLGKSPMVATQLYVLLHDQQGRIIREVILVYPAQATEIANGADLIEKALQEEAKVPCRHACIPDMKDIDSREGCQRYQTTLENIIDQVRKEHPDYTIDLALSGGRKGMTAMTIFAAQKKQLPYVYHTLIADEELSETLDQETTIEALNNLNREDRNDRLFLRAYEGDGPYTKFVLFKVPIFS